MENHHFQYLCLFTRGYQRLLSKAWRIWTLRIAHCISQSPQGDQVIVTP